MDRALRVRSRAPRIRVGTKVELQGSRESYLKKRLEMGLSNDIGLRPLAIDSAPSRTGRIFVLE